MDKLVNWKALSRAPLAWGLLLGLLILLAALPAISSRLEPPSSQSGLRAWQVFGSGGIRSDAAELSRADATAVLGKCTLDLTRAGLSDNGAVIRANAVMGLVEIRVPKGWRVRMQGMPVLGGYKDQTNRESAALSVGSPFG